MITLGINKQRLFFSLYKGQETLYQRDEDGDIVYTYVDDEKVPIEIGVQPPHYDEPVEFWANISMGGGNVNEEEYGLDASQYSAVVIVSNSLNLPINETSVLWHSKQPVFDENGVVDGIHAEYKVVKINKSLNFTKYILKKIVSGSDG